MGCSNCSSETKSGKPKGCRSNGYCVSGGCQKKEVFDWIKLEGIKEIDSEGFPYVEVSFKNGRKEFFHNCENLELFSGDWVVVNVPNGHHIGRVSLQGELGRLQMRKKKVDEKNVKEIYRKASKNDLEKFREAQNRENPTLFKSREIIEELKLKMKLSDVEYQADMTKATFFYSAEDRVDFRELIKKLANEFKLRVEMKQISLRHEASFLGGIGSCGRELCCSTWLTEFKSVNTSSARYQNLAINPSKLSGQCGRLKCCLNYELDTYMTALDFIPKIEKSLDTKKGQAFLQRTDIFRKIMYFSYKGDSNWQPVKTSRVSEIIALNKKGEIPFSLDSNREGKTSTREERTTSIVETGDLAELDKKLRKYSKKKRKFPKGKKNKNSKKDS